MSLVLVDFLYSAQELVERPVGDLNGLAFGELGFVLWSGLLSVLGNGLHLVLGNGAGAAAGAYKTSYTLSGANGEPVTSILRCGR